MNAAALLSALPLRRGRRDYAVGDRLIHRAAGAAYLIVAARPMNDIPHFALAEQGGDSDSAASSRVRWLSGHGLDSGFRRADLGRLAD